MSLIDRASEAVGPVALSLLLMLAVTVVFGGTCSLGYSARSVTGDQTATCVRLCEDGIRKFNGDDECICKSGITTKVAK